MIISLTFDYILFVNPYEIPSDNADMSNDKG